ncbi:hypothetical protein NEOLEDRAFT_1139158 [Neolentinus lepideus HHB14362 ss-1]|uniref:BTB domain-containing protein n=1 Tax=Neolentinus lepideus HHB14362 ss-1 TaxID=1314782 RepID=A0A165PVL2_9AGAM|nr:hypothetical protein NEOLEDRAFT_1139158 [Neolentinus lepideus HHB14362 ss-1]
MDWIQSRVDQPKLRWELTQCSTISGSFEIRNLSQLCRSSQNAITLHYNSPIIGDKWVIEVVIRDRSTEWIGMYLKPKPITRLALGRAEFTLKSSSRQEAIATWNFDKIHEFLPDNFGLGTRQFCRISMISDNEVLREHDVLYLEYSIAEYPEGYFSWTLGLRPPLQQLSEVMASMFDDPDTADVSFMIDHPHASRSYPRPIYAHSRFLAARCDYFKTLFGSGFAENKESLHTLGDIAWEESAWEQGSDSDYDDPAGDDAEESLSIEETDVYAPVIDDPLPVGVCTPKSTGGVERRRGAERSRRVVHISDFSYRTFRTILHFLYTGCIAFAPLTSTYRVAVAQKSFEEDVLKDRRIFNQQRAIAISPNGEVGTIPWASPKSIYRLADKLDISELKVAAAQVIRESMTPDTVVRELGSSFTSLFPEILQFQEEYVENNWVEVCKTSSFEDLLDRLFQNYAGGQARIWLKLIKSAIRNGQGARP